MVYYNSYHFKNSAFVPIDGGSILYQSEDPKHLKPTHRRKKEKEKTVKETRKRKPQLWPAIKHRPCSSDSSNDSISPGEPDH